MHKRRGAGGGGRAFNILCKATCIINKKLVSLPLFLALPGIFKARFFSRAPRILVNPDILPKSAEGNCFKSIMYFRMGVWYVRMMINDDIQLTLSFMFKSQQGK